MTQKATSHGHETKAQAPNEARQGKEVLKPIVKFARDLQSLMEDYATLPDQDRFAVDKAITQHLDVSPKDWVMGVKAITTALHVKQ